MKWSPRKAGKMKIHEFETDEPGWGEEFVIHRELHDLIASNTIENECEWIRNRKLESHTSI